MTAPVLLISSAAPGASGIGGQVLADLMVGKEPREFAWVVEPPFALNRRISGLPAIDARIHSVLVRMSAVQALRLWAYRRWVLHGRVAEIVREAERIHARCIWITTSSPELIWIGEALAAKGADLRVMVWDDPTYLTDNLRLPPSVKHSVWRSFTSLLRSARRTAVISQAMATRYAPFLANDAIVIRHGVTEADMAIAPRRVGETLKVVFAGSLYAKREWNAFVRALDASGWCIDGRQVELFFLGSFPRHGAIRPRQMRVLGMQPFRQAMKIMAEMDIGYLPYWFDAKHELVARTSFPGKMSAYAAAGLAIFHHAPVYSEGTSFLRTHSFGVSCASHDAGSIAGALLATACMIDDPSIAAMRERALAQELSALAMQKRLETFLSPVGSGQ